MVNSIYLKRPTQYQTNHEKFELQLWQSTVQSLLVTPYKARVCGVIPKLFPFNTSHVTPFCKKQTQYAAHMVN